MALSPSSPPFSVGPDCPGLGPCWSSTVADSQGLFGAWIGLLALTGVCFLPFCVWYSKLYTMGDDAQDDEERNPFLLMLGFMSILMTSLIGCIVGWRVKMGDFWSREQDGMQPPSAPPEDDGGLSAGAIAGIAIGACFGVLWLIGAGLTCKQELAKP